MFVAVALGPLHARDRPRDDLVLVHPQLELAVDRAGGQEDVDPGVRGVLQRFPRAVDVFVVAAGQAADRRAADRAGDLADRLEIAGRSDREAGLDHVDAQVDQRLGDLELLLEIHAAAGRLLAVAERGVENDDVAWRDGGHGIGPIGLLILAASGTEQDAWSATRGKRSKVAMQKNEKNPEALAGLRVRVFASNYLCTNPKHRAWLAPIGGGLGSCSCKS